MKNTKKIAIFTLSILALTGWAYVFRDSALFDGLSSNVLNQSFVCTESNIQSESASYRKTKIRYKKALAIQKNLESEIAQIMATKSEELQKKQDVLKILKRQIVIYTRFIKRYDSCIREVHLQPIVSSGLMSGEAKVIPSLPNEYQELVGLEIASPENLNTYINTLQFQVRMTPATSITVDQWLLTNDMSAPSPCLSSQSGEIITLDCDMLGGIPSSIPSTTKNTFRLWAHIISVDQTVEGSIEISVLWMTFNDGREGFENNTTPSILQYGVVPVILPVLPQPEIVVPADNPIITPLTDPSSEPTTSIILETPPVVIVPVPDVPISDTPSSGDIGTLPTSEPSSGTEIAPVPPASEPNIPVIDEAVVN